MTAQELNDDMAEAAEERLNDRLAEPRRYSIFYEIFAKEGQTAVDECTAEIGLLKALKEEFQGVDQRIVAWCRHFTDVAVAKMEVYENDCRKDREKAKEYRRIEDVFRRRQSHLLRGDGLAPKGPAGGPGERENGDPEPGPSNGGVPGWGADPHFRADEKRKDAHGPDARGEHGEAAGIPPLFHF